MLMAICWRISISRRRPAGRLPRYASRCLPMPPHLMYRAESRLHGAGMPGDEIIVKPAAGLHDGAAGGADDIRRRLILLNGGAVASLGDGFALLAHYDEIYQRYPIRRIATIDDSAAADMRHRADCRRIRRRWL